MSSHLVELFPCELQYVVLKVFLGEDEAVTLDQLRTELAWRQVADRLNVHTQKCCRRMQA